MPDISTFDPNTFLNTETTSANETRFQPVPEGDYEASIDRVQIRVQGEYTILEATWHLHNEEVEAAMNMDRVTCRQSVFLDIEGDALAQGENKNVQLGRLREAVGQNQPGTPWSLRMLEGAGPAMVHITTKQDKNGDDRSNVTRVVTLQ